MQAFILNLFNSHITLWLTSILPDKIYTSYFFLKQPIYFFEEYLIRAHFQSIPYWSYIWCIIILGSILSDYPSIISWIIPKSNLYRWWTVPELPKEFHMVILHNTRTPKLKNGLDSVWLVNYTRNPMTKLILALVEQK